MHSSLLLLSAAFTFALLVVCVTPIPAGFPELAQDEDNGNLLSSSSFLLTESPSIYTGTGIEVVEQKQSFGPVSLSPANNLWLQSIPDEITDTSTGTDLLWDTGTGTDMSMSTGEEGIGGGGEEEPAIDTIGPEYLYSNNNNFFDFSDPISNNNNNFDLLASAPHEPYWGPDIEPGDFDDSRFDPLAKCPMESYRYAACCGRALSKDRYIPDCSASKFSPLITPKKVILPPRFKTAFQFSSPFPLVFVLMKSYSVLQLLLYLARLSSSAWLCCFSYSTSPAISLLSWLTYSDI